MKLYKNQDGEKWTLVRPGCQYLNYLQLFLTILGEGYRVLVIQVKPTDASLAGILPVGSWVFTLKWLIKEFCVEVKKVCLFIYFNNKLYFHQIMIFKNFQGPYYMSSSLKALNFQHSSSITFKDFKHLYKPGMYTEIQTIFPFSTVRRCIKILYYIKLPQITSVTQENFMKYIFRSNVYNPLIYNYKQWFYNDNVSAITKYLETKSKFNLLKEHRLLLTDNSTLCNVQRRIMVKLSCTLSFNSHRYRSTIHFWSVN